MKKVALIGGPGSFEDSVQALARALFRGDLQDSQIKQLPPQNLYLAFKSLGLESCQDVLSAVSQRQYRALLDFELWTRDSFREDRFWAWLDAIDDPMDLIPLQRCINSLDPDLLALIVRRYVDVEYHEEKDDLPPGPNFYSPDNGRTWIAFKTHDSERHRLLGKLLAFLYQTNSNIFYEILLQAQQGTSLEFEENAFQGRSHRLLNEYIPLAGDAALLHAPLSLSQVTARASEARARKERNVIEVSNYPVIPLFVRGVGYQPLRSILEQFSDERLFETQSEFSKILNSAVVFFLGDFAEESSLTLLTEQVFGVVNVALQVLQENSPENFSAEIISELTFTELYQLGLGEVYSIRKRVQKIPADIVRTLEHMNPALSVLVDFVSQPLPLLPAFFREDGSFEIEDEKLSLESKPISSLEEITSVANVIEQQIEEKFFEIRSYEKQSGVHKLVKDSTSRDLQ
jgi:hypothetical protein